MEELREKMASALHTCVMQHDPEQPPWEHLSKPFKEECLFMALAALRAIEEAGYVVVPKTAGRRLIDSAREQSEKLRNLEEPRG